MILDELISASRARVAASMALEPFESLAERVAAGAPPAAPCFTDALRAPGVSLIAEVKRASPSRGTLNDALDPGTQALRYARAGADAISVLTEPSRFHGSLADLANARQALQSASLARPLLRKDFIVDGYQILEARLAGAAAVLLIAAALDPEALGRLYDQALAVGLCPLVEVHDRADVGRILSLQPAVIGINNRDLRTFQVDIETTFDLRPTLPAASLVVAESGIHSPAQVRRLAALGVDGVLVGEALVTAADVEGLVQALKDAGR
ncbi:MAG: indole-3-glycerol phosphate synthase TrpC [Anaerolineae bacterium]